MDLVLKSEDQLVFLSEDGCCAACDNSPAPSGCRVRFKGPLFVLQAEETGRFHPEGPQEPPPTSAGTSAHKLQSTQEVLVSGRQVSDLSYLFKVCLSCLLCPSRGCRGLKLLAQRQHRNWCQAVIPTPCIIGRFPHQRRHKLFDRCLPLQKHQSPQEQYMPYLVVSACIPN